MVDYLEKVSPYGQDLMAGLQPKFKSRGMIKEQSITEQTTEQTKNSKKDLTRDPSKSEAKTQRINKRKVALASKEMTASEEYSAQVA